MFGSVPNNGLAGFPALQSRQIPIGVPSEFGNTVEILSSTMKEIEGKIIPIPSIKKDGEMIAYKYEVNENYYSVIPNNQAISFGEFAIVRGMPVQYFIINPVSFSPTENKIKLYNKIVFRINYSQNQNNFIPSKDNFLADIVPNFNVAKNWIKEAKNQTIE